MKSVTSKVRKIWNQRAKSISHSIDSGGMNHRQDMMTHWENFVVFSSLERS
jgi:hypothetical protein